MSKPRLDPWGERAVRVAVIGIVVGLAGLLALRVVDLTHDEPKTELAQARQDETTVADAFVKQPAKAVIVRGYVFAGDGFPARVCSGIRRASPPECVGPFLELRNLDPSRVPVRSQQKVIWSPEPVSFLGRVDRDRFLVQELLS